MPLIGVPFHLDEPLPCLPFPTDRVVAPALPDGGPWERMAVLYEEVARVVAADAGRVPWVASGDCTTSMGVVAGLQRAGIEPSVVWFDAHGDVQTTETSASGYLGGMPVRQLIGGADRTVPDALGLRPVREEDVVLVDARDLDPPEAEFLAGSAIRRCAVGEIPAPTGPVYLHLDVDVIDPQDVPGLLFPVPGGPRMPAVAEAVRRLLASGHVVAVGLACTVGSEGGEVVAALLSDLAAGNCRTPGA